MLHRIHQKLGTAGFIISIVALVAALGGGAYAAKAGLTGKQKKEVEKIAKKYAGKPGKAGATGATGPAGAKGDKGNAGSNGSNGTNGTAGVNGKGVVVSNAGGNCTEGGIAVEVEGSGQKSFVCNGEEGPEGRSGWAPELPSEKTETGAWGVGKFTEADEETGHQTMEAISFPFPLPSPPAEGYPWEIVPMGGPPTAHCKGTSTAPTAEPGFFCLYVASQEGPLTEVGFVHQPGSEEENAGSTGAILTILRPEAFGWIYGTWAVTAL
jgi:hypothetical protein